MVFHKYSYLFFLIFFTTISNAQNDGTLNTSFDSDGILDINHNNHDISPEFIEELSDNSILVGVNCRYPHNYKVKHNFITKLQPDGSTDLAFGVNGKILFSGNTDIHNHITSVEKLPNDDFLVLGVFNDKYQFYKIDEDGNFDYQFGNQGLKKLDNGSYNMAHVSLTNGKIIRIYNKTTPAFKTEYVIERYHSNGDLDLTFGNNGEIIHGLSLLNHDFVLEAKKYSNNKFITIGNSYNSATYDTGVIAMFSNNGALDQNFGNNGMVIMNFDWLEDYTRLFDFEVLDDHKILICGETLYEEGTGGYYGSWPILVKLNPDGSLDTTFGNNGKIIFKNTLFNANDSFKAIEIQSDGKILLLGKASYPFPYMKTAIFIKKLNPNGTLDTSFGNNGIFQQLYTPNNSSDEFNRAFELKILKNDNLLVSANHEIPSYTTHHIGKLYKINNSSLSINQANKTNIKVSPNPFEDYIYIDKINTTTNVLIYDITGRIVFHTEISKNTTIDLNHLQSGLYLIRLLQENSMILHKIVKE